MSGQGVKNILKTLQEDRRNTTAVGTKAQKGVNHMLAQKNMTQNSVGGNVNQAISSILSKYPQNTENSEPKTDPLSVNKTEAKLVNPNNGKPNNLSLQSLKKTNQKPLLVN